MRHGLSGHEDAMQSVSSTSLRLKRNHDRTMLRNSFWLGNIVGTSFPSSGAYCIQQLATKKRLTSAPGWYLDYQYCS